MPFNFVSNVDLALFGQTKGAWSQQLEDHPESASHSHYDSRLEYLERCINGEVASGDSGIAVCAVVQDDNDYASALVTVSHAKGRESLKMLDVTVQPKLDLADREPNIGELAWIAAELIVGCLGLTYLEFPSKELKIRTSFPLDHEFLTAVTTVMLKNTDFSRHFDVSSHGLWLVVSKKTIQPALAAI